MLLFKVGALILDQLGKTERRGNQRVWINLTPWLTDTFYHVCLIQTQTEMEMKITTCLMEKKKKKNDVMFRCIWREQGQVFLPCIQDQRHTVMKVVSHIKHTE